MFLASWLSLLRPTSARPLAERQRARLHVELLEDRAVPSGMSLVGNWDGHGHLYADVWAEQVASGRFKGRTFAYLGHFDNQGGVDIIDITNPKSATLVSTFMGTGLHNEIRDIQVQNGIGYFDAFADPGDPNGHNGGVFIVDVSNPYKPVQLARIDPSNGGLDDPHTIFVDGSYLYEVRPKNPGIWVFDISKPASPSFVRIIPSPSGFGIHEVTVRNGRLYSADFHNGGFAGIFDITRVGDLSTPVPVLGFFKSGDATHTSLSTEDGNYVIVTHEFAGHPLEIYNISDPAKPKLASTIHLPVSQAVSSHQPMVVGNLLYVAWFDAGVRVYNIADPYHPAFVGDYDTYTGPYGTEGECAANPHGAVGGDFEPWPEGCGAWGVYPFLGNDRILVSDFDRGLFIVSLNNPPKLKAASPAPHAVNGILQTNQVQPLLTEALARWQVAGVDISGLGNLQIQIANLGGRTLGLASGLTITLDDNAAGWGWFVDRTPGEDSEFITPAKSGVKNRMDLLTVLEHEVGHLLGRAHEADGLMADTLAAGTRKVPGSAADAVFALLSADEEIPWLGKNRRKR